MRKIVKTFFLAVIALCLAFTTFVDNCSFLFAIQENCYNDNECNVNKTISGANDIKEGYELVFDAYYYYNRYKDVINISVPTVSNLFNNFKNVGMKKGYQGCASFNVQSYKERYPDLEETFGNNYTYYYLHYIKSGYKEGRDGSFDQELYDAELLKHKSLAISDDDIRDYYDKVVFIGDSVMVGYYYYASSHKEAWVSKADFLAQYSTAIRHSIIDVSEDPYQPSYKGEKINVWNAIPQMDVDKVFIMYGANDLGVYDPQTSYNQYLTLISKIRESAPNVEIHIISMTPVCAAKEGKKLNNNSVNQFNQLIIDGAKANNYYYVSLNPSLLDENGCLMANYSSDSFVHQTNAAYVDIWEPVFKEYATKQLKGTYELPANYSQSVYE